MQTRIRILFVTLLSLITIPAAHAETRDRRIDPCALSQKSNAQFDLNPDTGGFQEVLAGSQNKRIYVCDVVFSGSSNGGGFNINFAGAPSGCSSDFTFFGSLFTKNNEVVHAGGGNSTQFTLRKGNAFCIELGGVTPLRSDGWITYVRVGDDGEDRR